MQTSLQLQKAVAETFVDPENTNRLILQLPSAGEKKYVFFCPCYLRIWINNFSAFKIEDLSADLNVSVKFDLDITDLPKEILDYVKDNLVLNFCHADEPFELKNGKERNYKAPKGSHKKDKTLIGYRKKMTLTANMIPDIMYTPFEILNLIVTVEVPHIEIW